MSMTQDQALRSPSPILSPSHRRTHRMTSRKDEQNQLVVKLVQQPTNLCEWWGGGVRLRPVVPPHPDQTPEPKCRG